MKIKRAEIPFWVVMLLLALIIGVVAIMIMLVMKGKLFGGIGFLKDLIGWK